MRGYTTPNDLKGRLSYVWLADKILKKRLWPILRYYPNAYWRGWGKQRNTTVRVAGSRSIFEYLPNMKKQR